MIFQEKIEELREIIRQQLLPLMGKEVVLVDAPYYHNIGDVLIWQGIVDFLKDNNIKLLFTSSGNTFTFPHIKKDVTILLTGGGNFGDLYRWAQDTRIKVINHYPDNRIVMFPQSVWYEDKTLIEMDAKLMMRHQDLHLCARDNNSYDFLKKYYPKIDILLVPDIAFYIDDKTLEPYRHKENNQTLFLRRIDKELTYYNLPIISNHIDVRDWPTIETSPIRVKFIQKTCEMIERVKLLKRFKIPIYKYAQINVKDSFVKVGCEFLLPYKQIITTRLHAMILGILLHKPVKFIDNTTGKLSAYTNSWFKNIPEIKIYE